MAAPLLPISAAVTHAAAARRRSFAAAPAARRAPCARGRRPLRPSAWLPTHGPSCPLQLVCRGGAVLSISGCDLADASPLLREALAAARPDAGVLLLPDDDAKDWEVALQLLRPGSYAPHLVDWDNVHRLLALADKYDMVAVRGCCAHFLSLHASELDLGTALASPRNPLQAASLMESYCTRCEYEDSLEPYVEDVEGALERAIEPSDAEEAGTVADKLLQLTEQEEYGRVVAPSVQDLVDHVMHDPAHTHHHHHQHQHRHQHQQQQDSERA